MPESWISGIERIRRLDRLNSDIDPGRCKQRTREAFGIPSNGTASAAASWAMAPDQHRTRNPEDAPRYSFGWFIGGGHGYGHVVVNLGDGVILTPGGPKDTDSWYQTTVVELLRGWPNLRWVGWTRTIDGKAPAPARGPRSWSAFWHLTPYYIGNSFDGLRRGRRLGKTRVDLDFHLSAPDKAGHRVWANVHWSDGREHRAGVVKPVKDVRETPWGLVAKWRGKGGHRIRSGQAMLSEAARLGYKTVEADVRGVPSVEEYRRLQGHADKAGIELLVKVLSDRPGALRSLRNAKAAGCVTMACPRGSRKLRKADYWLCADYVRGPVTWV